MSAYAELLPQLLLFAAKTVLLVAAVGVVIALIARGTRGGNADDSPPARLRITPLHERLRQTAERVEDAVTTPAGRKALHKARRKLRRHSQKVDAARPRLFVLDFTGDLRATGVRALREEITAVLQVARDNDEMLLRLESPGGVVHGYGLAASQLERVRQRGIPLTVAVDKVAASGGYLMASVAGRILAAPFAIIGSIGVVMQIPNVHRLLKRHDIDVELHTAGDHKRTLTVLGENTDEGRAKLREELAETHALFKDFVAAHRPGLDLDRVATGEHWFGRQALELGLVDELRTSDDYLLEKIAGYDVFQVRLQTPRSFLERMTQRAVWLVVRDRSLDAALLDAASPAKTRMR